MRVCDDPVIASLWRPTVSKILFLAGIANFWVVVGYLENPVYLGLAGIISLVAGKFLFTLYCVVPKAYAVACENARLKYPDLPEDARRIIFDQILDTIKWASLDLVRWTFRDFFPDLAGPEGKPPARPN